MTCLSNDELLDRLHAIEGGEEQVAAAPHLTECGECSERWSQLRAITQQIGGDLEAFRDEGLVQEILTSVRRQPTSQKLRWKERRWWQLSLGLLPVGATAALLALWLAPVGKGPPGENTDGFRARSSLVAEDQRWMGLTAYRASPGEPGFERLSGTMGPRDALALAYRNGGDEAYQYLMVFAVSQRGQVFWYHPAFEQADSNPSSVRIDRAAEPLQLPDAVTHDLKPGWLRVFGIFSHEPLQVETIEATVEKTLLQSQDITELDRLPIDATGQHTFLVHVAGK